MARARPRGAVFCPTCRGLQKRGADGRLVCAKCGTSSVASGPTVSSKATVRETVVVDAEKDKISLLPTGDYFCDKCGNSKAYYFFRQTRSADEATTRFLECTKCGHKWRDYR